MTNKRKVQPYSLSMAIQRRIDDARSNIDAGYITPAYGEGFIHALDWILPLIQFIPKDSKPVSKKVMVSAEKLSELVDCECWDGDWSLRTQDWFADGHGATLAKHLKSNAKG